MGGGRCMRFALRIMLPVLRCGEGGLEPIFLPFINWKKIYKNKKMHDASPPGASVGSSRRTWRLVSLSFWSREDTGFWRGKKSAKAGIIISPGACK